MKGLCESEGHIGDRLVDRRDLTERRLEFRDLTSQNRYRTKVLDRTCKACVRRELAEPADPRQAALL